jgi:hypothetical protein
MRAERVKRREQYARQLAKLREGGPSCRDLASDDGPDAAGSQVAGATAVVGDGEARGGGEGGGGGEVVHGHAHKALAFGKASIHRVFSRHGDGKS